ncbi:3-dehydroquinate synthase [Phycisphaerales bacterium]|nr:3-dehydroquinate synthase [Phycisphaerales bacterium]
MTPLPISRIRVSFPPDAGRDRSYEVVIGAGVLHSLGELLPIALGRAAGRALVVFDESLPRDLLKAAHGALAEHGIETETLGVRAAEGEKSWAVTEAILKALANARFERDDPVIALGGGVIGDLAGFAAAIYRRGVPVIQCPTTLLAMVDASVGGKTGVNFTVGPPGGELLAKNLVGAFHQPRLVVIDTSTLRSLSPRHLSAGLAECIKHAMICGSVPGPDPGLTDWTRANVGPARSLDQGVLGELIARNVALKARVVERDEREEAADEAGGRAFLNLGHTFAHAVETLGGLGLPDGRPLDLLHGEAVALGLVSAARTARVLGLCDLEVEERVRQMLEAAGLPSAVVGLPEARALLTRMSHDKKARGGVRRLVLPVGVGRVRIVADPPEGAVEAGWDAVRG